MSRVLVPIATGFEEIEAVSIIDVLRRAGIEVLVAHVGKSASVTGANGIVIECDVDLDDIDERKLDMIVLPGGWGGTDILATDIRVQSIIKALDADGRLIGSICAAAYALSCAGVLKDRFTCYPSAELKIEHSGYLGDKYQVVVDQNIITSRGPATAICFALHIVKLLDSDEKYSALRAGLLAECCEDATA